MNNKKIKNHTRLEAEAQAERGEMTKIVDQGDEVPFGIRAIEGGCAVDGVWNSKATTPLQTPSSSKPSSPVLKGINTLKKGKRDSSSSNILRLDIPEPAFVTPNSRTTNAGMPISSLENSGSTNRTRVATDSSLMELEPRNRSRTAERMSASGRRGRSGPTGLTYSSASLRGSRPLPPRTSVGKWSSSLYVDAPD